MPRICPRSQQSAIARRGPSSTERRRSRRRSEPTLRATSPLASARWLRTGHRPALIVVDLWFVAFGSLLVDGGGNPVGMDDGLSVWTHAAYAALLGGAMPVIGIGWGALGVVGALAVWRSRRA